MASQPHSERISGDTRVVELLERFPHAEEVMVAYGFTCVGSPILRGVIPRALTVETAALLHGVDVASLLDALNHAVGEEGDAGASPSPGL